MIRITIIAIATFVLGFAAFAGVNHYTDASASSHITPHDADVDWSGDVDLTDALEALGQFGAAATGGRPVEEQNVDASGNIRVAQQGPVDVNVVSAGGERTILVAADIAVPVSGDVFMPAADVRGCVTLSAYLQATGESNSVNLAFRTSIDGVGQAQYLNFYTGSQTIGVGFPGTLTTTATSAGLNTSVLRAPYLVGHLYQTGGVPRTESTATVWLYCTI